MNDKITEDFDIPYPIVKAVKALLIDWLPGAPWTDDDVERLLNVAMPYLRAENQRLRGNVADLRGDYDEGYCICGCTLDDPLRVMRTERDALAATIARVRHLCDAAEGPLRGGASIFGAMVGTADVRAVLDLSEPPARPLHEYERRARRDS